MEKNNAHQPLFKRLFTPLALLCALSLDIAYASNLTVNSLADTIVAGDGQCTLREAIANANNDNDTSGGDCLAGTALDVIRFGLSGTVVLTSPLVINASIDPFANTVVDGVGQKIILSGNNAVQIFRVNPSATLTLQNLTLANGYVAVSGFSINGGGAILNTDGNVSVARCTFTGNVSTGNGGAIDFYDDTATVGGVMNVTNSTFSGNSAFHGGALANVGGGLVSLYNNTIVGNSSVAPLCPSGQLCPAVVSDGGGLANISLGAMFLNNNIVAGNTNVIKSSTADVVSASDINGFGISGNNNLVGSGNGFSGLLNGANGNVVGIDVNTIVSTVLADNGGVTQTLALLPASPALDMGNATACSSTDQRGVTRPQGSACDIGAFEAAITVDLAVTQTASPNPVTARDTVTWAAVVNNNGPANSTDVKLTDTLPTGLTSITASASQGTCAVGTGVITCDLGNLANAASATINIRAVTSAAGTLNNTVSVSATQADSQSANNSNSLAVTVQALLCNGKVPTIVGTPGNDTLRGTRRRDVIHGLGGNDTISGSDDDDTICGGEGNDALNGEAGRDALDGGNGTDSCNGGSGTDSGVNCEVRTSIP